MLISNLVGSITYPTSSTNMTVWTALENLDIKAILVVTIGLFLLYLTRSQPERVTSTPPNTPLNLTLTQLSTFTTQPILLSIKGIIYDVTKAHSFYGKGGPYASFAGKECDFFFATQTIPDKVQYEERPLTVDEKDRLQEWIDLFDRKYRKVGKIVQE